MNRVARGARATHTARSKRRCELSEADCVRRSVARAELVTAVIGCSEHLRACATNSILSPAAAVGANHGDNRDRISASRAIGCRAPAVLLARVRQSLEPTPR